MEKIHAYFIQQCIQFPLLRILKYLFNSSTHLEFFGEMVGHKCCEWREQRSQENTDIPDINGDVEEIHRMIKDCWCHHKT